MEVEDYQILDQHSDEQVWCPSQLLAPMPHLCALSTLCSPRWQNSLSTLTGIVPDIFIIFLFTFYQPTSYATYDQHFSSESEERLATGLALGALW